ncbi:hypothetical protein [Candidatus Poriferisodalis sp.]|uniref:hypothetical protein n=1 Tax=Candidatus Poriferisodalis sp. TaxID=3101277 RepID=UPI003C6ED8F2
MVVDVEGEIICAFVAGGAATRVVNAILRGVSEAAQIVTRLAIEATIEHPCDQLWDDLTDWADRTFYEPDTTVPGDGANCDSDSGTGCESGGSSGTSTTTPDPPSGSSDDDSDTSTGTYCAPWESFAAWGLPNIGSVDLYVDGTSITQYQGSRQWATARCAAALAALD